MMKYLVLTVMMLAMVGTVTADPSAPTYSNLLKNVTRAVPVQDSLDIPNCGVATGATLDSSITADAVKTAKEIYGASLPAGTNKMGVKCASAITYGDTTVTNVAVSNLLIPAATMVFFRGTTAELEAINFSTSGAATVTVYIFPFQVKY